MKAFGDMFRGFLRFLSRSRRIVLLIIIVAAITITCNVLIAVWLSRSYELAVPSMGTIYVTGVEAYGGDLKLINGMVSIDWGTLKWGDSRSVSFYLRSTSSVPARLALNVTDWNPERMKDYATVSWNYNGTQLAPQQEILVRFTLTTPDTRDFANYLVSNGVTSYNFTIYVYALE